MIKIYYKSIKEKEVILIDSFRIGSLVYLNSPTDEELELVSQELGFDLNALRDALDIYEVPRVEIENNKIYFYARVPYEAEKTIKTLNFLIAIDDNFILIITPGEISFLEELIFRENLNTTQRTKCFFKIFSYVNVIYSQVLTRINKKITKFTINITKITNRDISQFVYFETILNDFLAALIPMQTALNQLLQNKVLKFYEEDKELIENLILANNQLIELTKSNLKNIVNVREAYSTLLSNDLNQIIKIFTALTVIINIPVIIASFYGMNVSLPLQDKPDIFYWLIFLNLLIVGFLIILFIRKKWL
ncbi:MAG: magnesium transporter CorA [Candidatus Parcubacteria bacterium]|nr:MAG: magnesium transporter CorA [Candidatus Parcubacteria bacterium]